MPYPHGYKSNVRKLELSPEFWKKTNKAAGRDIRPAAEKKRVEKHNAYMKKTTKEYNKLVAKSSVTPRIGGYNEKPITGKSKSRNAYKNMVNAMRDAAESGRIPFYDAIKKQLGKSSAKSQKEHYTVTGGANTYYTGNTGVSYGNGTYSGSGSDYGYLQMLQELSDRNTAVNIAMNRENNDFAANQAALQRSWEQEMSNTAHQREVKDLQAAGLNPILSANAGAAVPSGAAAGASNFNGADASYVNALAGIIEATLSSNAAVTAAALNADAAKYGANKNYEANVYGTNKAYNASIVGTVERMIGDVITGVGAYKGAKALASSKALKTGYVQDLREGKRYPGKYLHA